MLSNEYEVGAEQSADAGSISVNKHVDMVFLALYMKLELRIARIVR